MEKVKKLQQEFGDTEEMDEESTVMMGSSSTATFSSRPNTTGFM